MARALVIEEERGTCSGYRPAHNGYYAGDFSSLAATSAADWSAPRHLTLVPTGPGRPAWASAPLAA